MTATEYAKARRARLIAAGLCVDCRDERGPKGTGYRCRPCARIDSRRPRRKAPTAEVLKRTPRIYKRHLLARRASTARKVARQLARGECVDCGAQRGENGTAHRCRECADADNRARTERLQRARAA